MLHYEWDYVSVEVGLGLQLGEVTAVLRMQGCVAQL